MSMWTVEAVYQNGVIRPLKPLALPENTQVRVRVKTLFPSVQTKPSLWPRAMPQENLGPLAGAFPELAAITDDDLKWAKQQWEQGVEKQAALLAG